MCRLPPNYFQYQGKKLEQLSIGSEAEYRKIFDNLSAAKLPPKVVRVEKRAKQRYAAAPFTTSTLQQEAVRKLGMTSERTMRIAQQLYEGVDIGGQTVGLISYMRTDSVSLAKEAVQEIRGYISENFATDYLPKTIPVYKSKSKNAQEAHEAVRPTSIARTPDSVRGHLTIDQARLYEMIWKRTLACQMAPARFDTVSLDIRLGGDDTLFRASGQTLVFPGFIAVYQEDTDDSEEEESSKLPPLAEGETIPLDKLFGEQHFTQPPPRFSEASLVKTLEEHGIGRPSTTPASSPRYRRASMQCWIKNASSPPMWAASSTSFSPNISRAMWTTASPRKWKMNWMKFPRASVTGYRCWMNSGKALTS